MTFIGVGAAGVRVSFEATHAHALGRVTRSTLRVDAASESLARTFALLPVGDVQVKRRRTRAFSGLYTFLVWKAIGIADTALLIEYTVSDDGVLAVSGWTFT